MKVFPFHTMHSRNRIFNLSFLFITLCCLALLLPACNHAKKPNIIFILADDLGWSDLPSYGNTFNEAPNLDKLMAEGMQFTNAYAACPVCSPTRASIQSGQYPARVGVIDFITGHWRPFEETVVPRNKTQYLPPEISTIAEQLQNSGYSTAYFGKWHLGNESGMTPADQGYDTSHVYRGGGFYTPRFAPPINDIKQGRISEILTELSLDFIKANKNNPFFLFLAHYDVHVQLDADQELIEKYLNKEAMANYPGNAVYAGMIEHLDQSVGKIVNQIKKLGLHKNTMIVFYSDNGGLVSRFDKIPLIAKNSLPYYENVPLQFIATSNAPLRAEKGTVYEGGIRVPLIICWPGKITPGSTSESLVSSMDFYPTFLQMAGTSNPTLQVIDGKSILPVLLENADYPERDLFWHYPVYHHGVPMGAVRKGDWKLIQNQVSGELALYNLRDDIQESRDVKSEQPDKTNELYQLLKNWQQDVQAEFPSPNPNFQPDRRYEWGKHPDRQ